jgi:hypothetical protein
MERLILIFVCTVMLSQPGFSNKAISIAKLEQEKTVESLFAEFSKLKSATHVKMGKFVMAFANLFSDTHGVTGVEVFSFDESEKRVKDDFNATIKKLKDSAYETLVSSNTDGELTKVLIKIKDDFIQEIVVIAGGSSPALVRIKGKIKPDDVNKIVEKNK